MSSRSSPDPIVLPSSPPSALDHSKHARAGPHGVSVSPSNKAHMSAQARSPWRLRPPVEARAQQSPRARRRHARQERRRLAGLDAITGRPLTADATDSPRKRRRLNSSREDDYEDADIDEDYNEGLVSLEETTAARYRAVDFDDNIQPRFHQPGPAGPEQHFSPSNDGSDGSVGYNVPEDAPGAYPTEPAGETTMANEEFTMISGQSLASLKANNSVLATADDFEPSHLDTVSANSKAAQTRPSLYPDVTRLTPKAVAASKEVRNSVAARNQGIMKDYDAMSWRPTGRSQHVERSAIRQTVDRGSTPAYESPGQRIRSRAREMGSPARYSSYQAPVSSQRERAQPSSVRGPTPSQPQFFAAAVDFDDIWAEEASRSLQDDARRSHEKAQGFTFVPPIFSDEPQPPRRSKIPSTWRKSSGIELSYSDSPQSVRQSSQAANARQDDGRRSGMSINRQHERAPTPSSDHEEFTQEDEFDGEEETSEDEQEADQEVVEDGPDEEEPLEDDPDVQDPLENEDDQQELLDEDHDTDDQHETDPGQQSAEEDAAQEQSELTNPDAAATQLQGVRNKHEHNPATPRSAGDAEGSEILGSGLLWHSNMPTLFSRPPIRPRRPKSTTKVNLSEILRMDATETAAVPSQSQPDASPDSNRYSAQRHRRERSSSAAANDISSPLARSLFKSSRMGGKASVRPHGLDRGLSTQHTSAKRRRDEQPSTEEDISEQDDEPTRSYQENLNKESPAKVRVEFNDSSLINPGIDLHNYQRKNSPLFDRVPPIVPQQEPIAAMPAKKKRKRTQPGQQQLALVKPPIPISAPDLAAPPPGFLSRLATSLWSALVRPSGPIYVEPEATETTQYWPEFPAKRRAMLRERYGVFANQHPWTLAHMRTLHRMLNSIIDAKPDSIVPTALPLPPYLSGIVGKTKRSVTNNRFKFKYQHACAINSFIRVLVPVSLVQAMERGEVAWLGDATAEDLRGRRQCLNGTGPHGSELCFPRHHNPEGFIDMTWLVKCMGCVVHTKELVATMKAREKARLAR